MPRKFEIRRSAGPCFDCGKGLDHPFDDMDTVQYDEIQVWNDNDKHSLDWDSKWVKICLDCTYARLAEEFRTKDRMYLNLARRAVETKNVSLNKLFYSVVTDYDYTVTAAEGRFKRHVAVRKSNTSWGYPRFDFWFTDMHGNEWWGRGGHHGGALCKKLKSKRSWKAPALPDVQPVAKPRRKLDLGGQI